MKHPWEMTEEDVEACLKATTWYPADRGYFRGGGYSSNFLTRGGMPMTMMRVNMVKGLGPVMQIAEGWTAGLDPEVHDILNSGDVEGAREALNAYNQYRKQKGLPPMRIRKLNGPKQSAPVE